MVSIIIPVYNAENTISQTLDSVFNQTYESFEIIIVNDGSTDQTSKILRNYTHPIKILTTENRGVSHARNLGFNHCIGKYIQYLDADDLLLPDKLKIQVEKLEAINGDVAYGDWQKFKLVNHEIEILETISRKIEIDIEIALFTDFWCPPAALLYSRRICDKLSWNQELPIIQDARYLLDAAMQGGKFIYTPGLMAQYRIEQMNSLSKKSEVKFVNDCLTNAIEIAELWKDDFINSPMKKKSVIDSLRFCINRLSVLDRSLALKAIEFLLQVEPQYLPREKGVLRTLSKLFGYKNAEMIASYKRLLTE